jgi:stage II sporulation protein D
VLVDSAQVELGAATAFSLIDAASGELLAREPAQTRVRVTRDPAGGLVVSAGGSTYPVRERLTLRPENDGMVLISGAPYRGTVTVVPGARGVTAINVVDMESYLLGVVPFEIGRVGEELFEASRAQAVAARTYAMRFLGRRSALGFDVFATVDDQVYGGAGGEHEPVSAAVRATRGELLTYRGEPIEALYHSTCAGVTAAIEEVWPEVPRPYLRSVVDTNPATGEAFDVSSSRFRWTTTWTADELQTILNRTLADSLSSTGVRGPGAIRSFEIDRLTPSGRIGAMRIITDNGDFIVGGDRIRWIFPTPVGTILNSSKFDLRIESDTRGQLRTVTAEGMGWGHGIGMCQVGAMGRARAGQDYRTILSAYYRDTVLTRLY